MTRRSEWALVAVVLLGCGSHEESRPNHEPAYGALGMPKSVIQTRRATPEEPPSAATAPQGASTPPPPAVDAVAQPPPTDAAPEKPRGPVVDESVQAFGRRAFELLRTGDRDGFLALTNYANPELRKLCPRLHRSAGLESKSEVEARFEHCRKVLNWDSVEAATVAGGELTGQSAGGCATEVAELEPIRMRVKTPEGISSVDLFQAVAREGEVIGISGAIKCAPLR